MSLKKFPLLFIVILALVMGVSACSSNVSLEEPGYSLASLTGMPLEIQNAPEIVSTAYQFAVANPDILQELPCYCGCGGMGHTSNYSCYVAQIEDDGLITYDGHALGCSICVDITVDAMRMLDAGKTLSEIQIYVDQTYSAFGPSNLP